MTIEVASFLVGSILLGVAIIGGGFEIKELRIPRVGPLARFMSLVVGGCFVLLGLGLAQVQAEMAAARVDASTSASFAPGPEPSSADAEVAAAEVSSSVISAPEPGSTGQESVEPEGFSGFTGSSRVAWVIAQTRIDGVMHLNGESGTMSLSFTDPTSDTVLEVEQDLVLRRTEQGIYYESYNSRYAGTQQLVPEYRPDFFFVGAHESGGWAFTRACDGTECSEIMVEPI